MQGDIEQMPFADAFFDVILAESVTVFTDIDQTISEYVRILGQGGVLLDLEMTAIPPLTQAMKEAFEQLYGIQHIPSEKEWQNKYEQAGFHSRSEEHTSELQSRGHLVCRLLLEKK